MNKQEQGKRLYEAVERLAIQAGEETNETIDWLCGDHGGMAKLFQKYFSPVSKREWVGLTDADRLRIGKTKTRGFPPVIDLDYAVAIENELMELNKCN